MFTKMGKARLRQILHQETGIPIGMLRDSGKYEYYDNEERIDFGAHSIVNNAGGGAGFSPCYGTFADPPGYTRRIRRMVEVV